MIFAGTAELDGDSVALLVDDLARSVAVLSGPKVGGGHAHHNQTTTECSGTLFEGSAPRLLPIRAASECRTGRHDSRDDRGLGRPQAVGAFTTSRVRTAGLTARRRPCVRAASVGAVAREVELLRHTDNDGDALTAEGIAAALEIGARLRGGYQLGVSTGAQRATQTLACFLAGLGQRVPGGVVVEPGLRSEVEDRWREAFQKAGSGALDALRDADPSLVAEDSERLGAALGRVFELLAEGGRALVVGHSPTNEAAVLGLTGEIVEPIAKGAGVLVVAADGGHAVLPLPA
jgi:broad specificity phosphatase PhoE